MDKKHGVRWLYGELPGLVKEGVVTSAAAEKLRSHYGPVDPAKKITVFQLFAVIGALLTALGIILVFAYNWDNIARPFKITLAVLPMVIGQVLCAWILLTGQKSASWKEGTAVFWAVSIGAAVAIISQAYHVSGKLSDYMLIWLALCLPVVYILDSITAFFVYLTCLTIWACSAQIDGGNAVLYWLLLLPAAPFVYGRMKEDVFSNQSLIISFLGAISVTIGLGVTLEKCLPGLWVIIYTAFFALLYIAGGMLHKQGDTLRQKPLTFYGVAGLAVILFMLTFRWPWEEIGWNYYRRDGKFVEFASAIDYIFAVGLPFTAFWLLSRMEKKRDLSLVNYGIAPGVVAVCYVIASAGGVVTEAVTLMIINIYVLYLGIATMVIAIREGNLGAMNGGMLLFAATLAARFFDIEMSFLARGIAFIVLGILFLSFNAYMSRRLKGAK